MSDFQENVVRIVIDSMTENRRAQKDAWITDARAAFVPSMRAPCFVCGKHRAITHAHHIIPLAAQFDRGFEKPDHSHIWLCPNHHTIVHAFIAGITVTENVEGAKILLEGTSQQERMAIYQVVMSSAKGPST